MSNREKIILVAMVLAILYGAYNFFFDATPQSRHSGNQQSIEEINRFVADMSLKLSQKSDSKARDILTLAGMTWDADPFVVLKPPPVEAEAVEEPVEKKPEPEAQFTYTGYLHMGDLTIAIIDGLEYEMGDELAGGEYVVKQIDPKRVVLRSPKRKRNITVLLNETQ